MIAIAQSLLNMNNDTRKDYTLKYERLLKETKASVSSTKMLQMSLSHFVQNVVRN